jgi:SAM-dependent methyltransferase
MPAPAPSPVDSAASCPICGKARILPGWKRAQGEDLNRCRDCGFAWFPRGGASLEAVKGQYLENETSPAEYYQLAEPFSLEAFDIRMKRIIRDTGSKTGRILDIGCNVGTFLQSAARSGWTPVGVEPNPQAARRAAERGFEVHCGFFDDALAAKLPLFDVVHMGDIIEHVYDPVELLRQVRRVLRPGGLLVVVTPDIDSVMGRLLQIKPGEHLVYFSKGSLQLAAEKAGLLSLSVERWGRRRSISSMRYSTTFSPGKRALIGLLDLPLIRSAVELGLFHLFKDEVLLVARQPAR